MSMREKTSLQEDVVAIVRAFSYREVRQKLQEGIKAIGGLQNLENLHVVIKPNLCCAKSSETGATIHVDFIRDLIEIVNAKAHGSCKISVVESDAEGINADYAFRLFDYRSLEEEFSNVKLVNLSKDVKMRTALNNGKAFDVLEIPKTLLDMEYMISVAKLKTHVDQRLSCILKNQFGLITRKHKAIFHPFLSEVIFDLNSLFMPDLCVVDGIIGMEGFGPTDGSPKRANLILVGTNPIATDIVAAKVVGFKPKQIPHLKLVMKASDYDEDKFDMVGDSVEMVRANFQFIPLKYYLLARLGLRLQKWGVYMSNLGEFLQKVRSALSIVGFGVVNKRVAFKDIIQIAKAMIFKFSD